MSTRMHMAVSLSLVIVLALAGCGGSGGSDGGSKRAAPTASGDTTVGNTTAGPSTFTAPLTIEPGSSPARATIGSDGGSITVTSPAGTTFTLEVPGGALLGPVEITATQVVSLGNVGIEAEGVVFEPPGLYFVLPATLTVTPRKPIPVDRQLVFTFSDDGTELGAAEPKMGTRDIVIVAQHFSGYGFADLADKARTSYVGWKSSRAETAIRSDVNDLMAKERVSQLLGGAGDPDLAPKLAAAMNRYEDEVVRPRLKTASSSCKAAKAAVADALSLERQRQLLGLPGRPQKQIVLGDLLEVPLGPCEKEAIAACRAAKDPSILVAYWLGANRTYQLVGGSTPYPQDGLLERAQLICDPQAYQIVGGLEDWQVSQVVCNIMTPFTLSTGIGTMKLSGGLTGTYTFRGVYNAQYSGTYTFSFANGSKRPGTLVGAGGGSIAGQSGSGAERYTVTPVGPAC